MPFEIRMTREAKDHIKLFRVHERRQIEAAVLARLTINPTTEAGTIKRLRPNGFAVYQMTVGDFRILYDVDGETVMILAFGRKVGNKLLISGEVFDEHQDNPAEPTSGKPGDDAD